MGCGECRWRQMDLYRENRRDGKKNVRQVSSGHPTFLDNDLRKFQDSASLFRNFELAIWAPHAKLLTITLPRLVIKR
jgi:hypothetical protein